MLDYGLVKVWKFPEVRQAYTCRDTILYSLSIGFGQDPVDPSQLSFVYEPGL